MMQFAEKFKARLISQLIKDVLRVLQKLQGMNVTWNLKWHIKFKWNSCFYIYNIIIIIIACKSWFKFELFRICFFYHLAQLCNVVISFLTCVNNYCYILLSCKLLSPHQAIWHYLLVCCLFCWYNQWMKQVYQRYSHGRTFPFLNSSQKFIEI